MEASAVARSRLIGAILVENDLITQEQLDRALQLQEESGDRLGEIVIAQFGVSRLDVASVLAEQWAVVRQASVTPAAPSRSSHHGPLRPPQPELPTGADARPRGRLGEIFLERGIITGDQLDEALHAQRESGERIGNILIERGVISRLDLADALAEQWSQLQMVRGPASASFPTPVFGGAIPAEPSTNRRPLEEIEQRLESLEHTVAESTGGTKLDDEIRSRLSALEKRAATIVSESPAPALVASVDELRAHVDGLMAESAGEVVELRREVEALRSDRLLADRVSELGATVASLTAGAEERDAAADDRVGHLNRDLGELNARVERLAETATRLQNDTKTAVDSLTDRLRTGDHRLIRLEASLTDHASQIEERLETVSQSIPDPARVEELQRRLTELERSREETDLPTYAHLHDEIERLAHRLPDSNKLESLTQLADTLGNRLDATEDLAADLQSGKERLDRLEGCLTERASRIEERLDTVSASIPDPGHTEETQRRLTALEQRADPAVAHLEQELQRLAQRLPDDDKLEALTRVTEELAERTEAVTDLTDRLTRDTATRSDLEDLSRRVDDIIGRLHDSQHLSHALQDLQARVDALMAESAGEVVELRREVEALRSDRSLADRMSELRATVASLTAGAEERAAAAEKRVGHLDHELGELDARVRELAGTATRLENGTQTAVDSLTDRLQSENERLIRLETSLIDHASRIEVRLEQESERLALRLPDNDKLEALSRVTDELAERTDALWARTADLGAQAAPRDGLADLGGRIDDLSSRLLDAHDVAKTLDELHARVDSSAAQSAAVSECMAGLRTELDEQLAEIATRQERQAHATASSLAAAREETAALMKAAAERSSLDATTRSDPAKRTKSPKGKPGKTGKKKRT